MATQTLVISRDPYVAQALGPLMAEAGMEMEVCTSLPQPGTTLAAMNVSTVMVDCDAENGGFELLSTIRQEAGLKLIAVGLTRDFNDMQKAFECGATFVLNKPLPLEDARRILRISKGVSTRVVRRFLRLPINTLSVATVDDKQEAIIENVSQRGLLIQCTESLSCGQMVYVAFLLPDTFTLVESMAQVMWTDLSGRAGVEFRSLADEMEDALSAWIYQRAIAQNLAANPPRSRRTTSAGETTITVTPADQLTPDKIKTTSAAVLGLALDGLVVAGGASLFMGISIGGGGSLSQWSTWLLGLFSGFVLWMAYRFLFTFFQVETPGKRAKDKITNADWDVLLPSQMPQSLFHDRSRRAEIQ